MTEAKPCHWFRYRVYWEDTDAGGVMYHARYLNFFERARTDYLLALGCPQVELKERTGRLFVVTHVSTDYLAPARLEDELAVSVCVEDIKPASMVFLQTIERQGTTNTTLARARVGVACLDATRFKPARLPQDLVAAIKKHIG
ncbi:MAG: tol-pal system-associated acyl-CoA thioesterase [Wenzhouxiangella sp.]|nr:tol-pal system-associated acyl-CoA thioesterase [Wenzhouxiangella sp.]